MKTLAEEFKTFAAQTWPNEMALGQEADLRKAFFAGALVALMLAGNETMGAPSGMVRIMDTAAFLEAMEFCEKSIKAIVVMNQSEGFAWGQLNSRLGHGKMFCCR